MQLLPTNKKINRYRYHLMWVFFSSSQLKLINAAVYSRQIADRNVLHYENFPYSIVQYPVP